MTKKKTEPASKGPLDYVFVGVQALLFILFFTLPTRLAPLPLVGAWLAWTAFGLGLLLVSMALLQMRRRLSPWPTPKEGAYLIRQGVFAAVRHPIYSGLFLMSSGWALLRQSTEQLIIAVLLLIWFYFKSRYEEKQLCQRFPTYPAYRQKTGRFFPRWGGFRQK